MKKIKILDVVLVVLLAAYLSLAITWRYDDPFDFSSFIFNYFVTFSISLVIIIIFLNKILNLTKNSKNSKIRRKEYIIYSSLILVVLVFSMFVFYPSIGNYDSELLWENIKNGIVDNWNPVPYVYIFIGIPSLISNNIFSTTIFQSIFVFLSTLYLFIYVRKNYLNFGQTLSLLLLFIFNPIYIKYSVFVSKDVIYSWALLFLTLNLINIVKSNSKWLDNRKNKVLFLLSIIAVLIFRHNGIIPFVFTFLYLILVFKNIRKFILISFISILVSFLFITGPIYKFLNIGGTLGHTEAMGVIMQNLSYYHMHSTSLTINDKKLLYNIIPENVWYTNYASRNFNHIKICENLEPIDCTYNIETLEKYTNLLIDKWFELTIKNPELFIRSYLNLTTPIWEIRTRMGEIDNLYWSSPELKKPKINQKFYNVYNNYYEFVVKSPLRYLFVTFGEGLFIIILSLTITIRKNSFKLEKITPFIPVITNALAIMLLITGEEYRFVYSQGICFIPLLLFSLQKYDKKEL